ncbi:hypothetical protein VP01_6643g1, partial [Puccinia sorghi]
TAFKASWPTCKPGWHNPKTKHKAEDCVQAKLKPAKSNASAKAAVDKSSNTESTKSISTAGGFLAIQKDSGMVAIKRALSATIKGEGEACFLDSGAIHHIIYKGRISLHMPKLAGTLISLGRLYEHECNIVCTGKDTFNLVKHGKPIILGVINNGTFSAKILVSSQVVSFKSSLKVLKPV